MRSKLHAVPDAEGEPIQFFVTAGQVREFPEARGFPNCLPTAEWLLEYRGFEADPVREALIDRIVNALQSKANVTQHVRRIRQASHRKRKPIKIT